MAACTIFEEDEVQLFNEKGFKCGLVLESSEYVSSDEEEDDPPFFERVRKGTIRVAWHPEGDEEVIQEKKVKLSDRSLMPGDVVRRLIEGQDSQRGYVIHTHVNTHIQLLGKNKVICDVASKDLQPFEAWNTDPGTVYLDSWTGRLERIIDNITVRFQDGAKCEVSDDDFFTQLANFEDLNEKRDRDSEFVSGTYYPGQKLKGDLGNLVSANWIKTTKAHGPGEAKKNEGKEVILTVEKVEPKSIEVHWVCRGYSKVEDPYNKLEPPPRVLHSEHIKRLKKLDCFEACSVQMGDKAFYVVRPTDKILSIHPKGNKPIVYYLLKERGAIEEENARIQEDQMNTKNQEIIDSEKTQSSGADNADHSQCNGQVEDNEDATDKESSETQLEEEDEWVDEKPGEEDMEEGEEEGVASDTGSVSSAHSNSSNPARSKGKKKAAQKPRLLQAKKMKRWRGKKGSKTPTPGDRVPVEIIYTASTVDVMWQDGTVEYNIASTDLFPIHHLDELEFFPGDFVVPSDASSPDTYGVVESVDHRERTCKVKLMEPYVIGQGHQPTERIISEELSVYDIKDHTDYKFRPGQAVVRVGGYEEQLVSEAEQAAGQVYELGLDGRLCIQWPDMSQSKCYPQELFLIDDVLSELNDSEFDSDSESDSDSMGDSDSNASWETEKEESADDDDDDADGDKTSEAELTVEAEKKVELDLLLDTAKSTLQKLEETFAQNVDIGQCVIHCYKEILHIYRNCRDLDKMLSASYFEEEKLSEVISSIRKNLKLEKTLKLTKAVLELFQSNSKQGESKPEVSKTPKREGGLGSGADSGIGKSPSEVENVSNKAAACGDTAGNVEEQASLVAAGLTGIEGATEQLQEELAKLGDQFKQLHEKGFIASNSVVQNADSTNSHAKEDQTVGNAACGDVDPTSTVATQTLESTDTVKAKELCKKACHLLREQIIKVHNDLQKKWQKLKASGKLHIVGEDESSSDSEDGQGDEPSAVLGSPGPKQSAAEENQTPMTFDTPPRNKLTPLDLKQEEKNVEALFKTPVTPQTPAEVRAKLEFNKNGFELLDSVPESHKFRKSDHNPSDPKAFMSAVRKEIKLLRSSLPNGIYVKACEERMDLLTVMIEGPSNTPYEDGLFFFEVQLPNDYPGIPPVFHYIAFCNERLNPNLYEEGKVCVSLLGTWTGRGTEVWTGKSSLLQVLISIQGLILNSEPYYNEAGYEKQKGSQQGTENSRMYNEMAILKLVQSMTRMAQNPLEAFRAEILRHMHHKAPRMIGRLKYWLNNVPSTSQEDEAAAASDSLNSCLNDLECQFKMPDFPLLPVSKGFCLTLRKNLDKFESVLKTIDPGKLI